MHFCLAEFNLYRFKLNQNNNPKVNFKKLTEFNLQYGEKLDRIFVMLLPPSTNNQQPNQSLQNSTHL